MEPGEQTYVFAGRRWHRPGYAALAEEIGRIELSALAAQNHCERLLKESVPDRGLRGVATADEITALGEVLARLNKVLDGARRAVDPLRDSFSHTNVPERS